MTHPFQAETARSRVRALRAAELMVARMADEHCPLEQVRERRQRILEHAAAAAKIGIWECELKFETLTWTNGVYDIFELPRGFRVTRAETLGFYPGESRKVLEDVRHRAIRQGRGFTLDTRITTALGKPRWLRIAATVETENDAPARIFGIMQDITDEKARSAALVR